MPKIRSRSKNTIKIAELQQELALSGQAWNDILSKVGIRLEDDQRNLDQNEVGRIRKYLNEKKRKAELQGQTIALPSIVKVQDLANVLELSVGDILGVLLKNGVMATLNDDIDYDTAAIIAQDLGYKTEEHVEELVKDVLTTEKLAEILKKDPGATSARPPVVTIMGHVDHGKTTLLDTIRSSNVAKKEAGGITQSIRSYQVNYKNRLITFVDTPGHATFEFMRRRGASLADVAILVVAADDGVKPQTKEAAKHAQEAGVPLVVAINKIDKPAANIDKVKKELSEQLALQPEEWGGKTVMVAVSALTGAGIPELLEMILLTSDITPPKANVERSALGTVVESSLDTNMGPLATVLIHTGTVRVGDNIVIGKATGRARRLIDFIGKSVPQAGPSMPVTIVGLNAIPDAGDIMQVVDAKEEAQAKASQHRAPAKSLSSVNKDDKRNILALVIKADTHGSLEALRETIKAMVPPEVRLSIIRADVGAVSDSDVLTAQAAGAIIYAFNTPIGGMAKKLAEKEAVSIKIFKIIYELTDDVRLEIEERLPFDLVQTDLGTLKVSKLFFAIRQRKIVGGEVAGGTIEKDSHAIIWRKVGKEKEEIGRGIITDLQIEKKSVAKAVQGDQVGVTFAGKGKIKEGDTLEIYREEKIRQKTGAK